ncbi:MAG: hypothetical protein ACYDBJ_22760 [Aggregatilineales bacterium]
MDPYLAKTKVDYSFTQNGDAKNGEESVTRNDLALSGHRGFGLFGDEDTVETSETNHLLPEPGTPVAILLLDESDRFIVL